METAMVDPPGFRLASTTSSADTSILSCKTGSSSQSPVEVEVEQAGFIREIETPIGSLTPTTADEEESIGEASSFLQSIELSGGTLEEESVTSNVAVFERGSRQRVDEVQAREDESTRTSQTTVPRFNSSRRGADKQPVVETTTASIDDNDYEGYAPETMPETAQATIPSWHGHRVADAASMVLSSNESFIASEWVEYVDEMEANDNRSMSLAGSPERRIGHAEEATTKSGSEGSERIDEMVAPTDLPKEPPMKKVSFVGEDDKDAKGQVAETMLETAQATFPSGHDARLADATSIIMDSGASFIANEWVEYVDEREDDILSMSLAGSPDRSIGRAEGTSTKEAPEETAGSEHLAEIVDPPILQKESSLKKVSFVGEDEPSQPSINRESRKDPSGSPLDLSRVSQILDQSFLQADGEHHKSIQRKIEEWDADIKAAVTNLDLLHGFPRGLAFKTARKSRSFHPLRLWLIDNNGATSQGDELSACIDQQMQISETMDISSIFCLLNSLQQIGEFSISSLSGELPISMISTSTVSGLTSPSSLSGNNKSVVHDDPRMQIALMIQQSARQKKKTEIPWDVFLRDAGRQIESADAQLIFHQQSVVLCIVTDEFNLTDEIASALYILKQLPVTLVIRLIGTVGREVKITELRDKLALLGLHSIQVLGDLQSHQFLVRRVNPWLHYGVPLHRFQEMGLQSRTTTLLEERCLTHHELREFLVVLFGRHVMLEAPDILCEWPSFLRYIKWVNDNANTHWNGITKQSEPWLDILQLDHMYGMQESRSMIQAIEEIRARSQYSATQVEL